MGIHLSTFVDIKLLFLKKLCSLYEDREILSIFYFYMEKRWGLKKASICLYPYRTLSSTEMKTLLSDIASLTEGTPVQQVCGTTDFYGLSFRVTPAVLIPRPETEELVEWILQETESDVPVHILDIGTGSGAIAIALAHHLPLARVTAIDYSREVLYVAQQNACANNSTNVLFQKIDITRKRLEDWKIAPVNIIVSNPPYIPWAEKEKLPLNVREHEPETALFVPTENPLFFYEKIAAIAQHLLAANGNIYVETHENFHTELENMFHAHGFQHVEKRTDINQKPRMMKIKKTN
ncbi:MAG: peptide chain release factor N(5)-glutamine methyltransferase [Bacteroidales bacterium]|jgi:release factor glutamine methyltransferase|nr:peptide chain release factor N(5)-glutamine methyltransferase [Bacteroidales bacterium]